MTTLRRILLTTSLAVAACGAASASSISIFAYDSFDDESPFTDTFSLANFNTSLGTLTRVTITLAYSTNGSS